MCAPLGLRGGHGTSLPSKHCPSYFFPLLLLSWTLLALALRHFGGVGGRKRSGREQGSSLWRIEGNNPQVSNITMYCRARVSLTPPHGQHSLPRVGHLLPAWLFTLALNLQSVCFRKVEVAQIISFTYCSSGTWLGCVHMRPLWCGVEPGEGK